MAYWRTWLLVVLTLLASGSSSAAPMLTFNWLVIASETDFTRPLFPNLGSPDHPFTEINGGLFTVTSLTDLPATSSALSSPSNLTISFGDLSFPFGTPSLVLTSFNNGAATGVALQEFTPALGAINSLEVFNGAQKVADGQLLSIRVSTNTSFASTALGRFRLTGVPAGGDSTIFDELNAVSFGTGIFEFSTAGFPFVGSLLPAPNQNADAARFTSQAIATPIPEPEPSMLLALGLAVLAVSRRNWPRGDVPPIVDLR
jgi:hypothetical protein